MSKEHSLKVSFWDGFFACIMTGATINYLAPFLLFLGGTTLQVGFLSSFPQLFSSIIQLKSAEINEKIKSRVKLNSIFVYLQSFTWFIVPFILFLPAGWRVFVFILIIISNSMLGAISLPVWSSLMSDTIDKTKYGEYFSWRGRVLGFVNLACNLLSGFFLFAMPDKKLAFISLFIIAGITRILSAYFLSQMDDIPVEIIEAEKFSYLQFIKRLKESNFVRFTVFAALISFTTFFAAPFFVVYMLRDLKFDYSTFTIITTCGALGGLISLPFWGNFADRFGNIKIINATSYFIAIFPMLWALTENPLLIMVINALGGYIWAGYNLSAVNFIYDASRPQVRTRCVAYFNFTNGAAIFLGGIFGSFLATHIPKLLFDYRLQSLFFFSGVSRVAVYFITKNSFREVREVKEIKNKELIYVILGIQPMLNLGGDIIYRFRKISNHKPT